MPLREIIIQIYSLFPKVSEAMELLHRSLIYRSPGLLDSVDALCLDIRRMERELTRQIVDAPDAANYLSISGHLERMAEHIERMCNSIRIKNRERIFFSDKATDEVNFLFEKLQDILENTADMVLARNRIIAGYVREAELSIEKSAVDFVLLHEERLSEGICLPKASALYLELLDAFKAIAWHSKELVQKLLE